MAGGASWSLLSRMPGFVALSGLSHGGGAHSVECRREGSGSVVSAAYEQCEGLARVTEAQQQWDIVSSVGLTAVAVAAGRAIETHRADPLTQDPYAESLVQAAAPPVLMPTHPRSLEHGEDPDFARLWGHLADRMAVRTRFFDQFFEQAIRSGASQAVILAAGLDTRAFRLPWPQGFRVFEIDQPRVLDFKNQVLGEAGAEPSCERGCVRVDLRQDWASALTQAGFDPGQPTAWLAEGLLPYLPAEAEQRLLTMIHYGSAPGSSVAIEGLPARSWRSSGWLSLSSRFFGLDMHAVLHEDDRPDPETTLAALGWTTSISLSSDVAELHQRTLTPLSDESMPDARFITAHLPR